MAVDMFLKLNGVDGEANDAVYGGHIDVLAWEWGMSQNGTFHVGGGGGAGKANFQDIKIIKYIDKATPTLMNKISTGEHITSATLIIRKAGSKPLDYLVIEMEKVMVASLITGTKDWVQNDDDDRLTEELTLNFAKVKTVYTPQKEDGTGQPAVEFGFDIAKNQPA